MHDIIVIIKTAVVAFISSVFAYLAPVHEMILCIIIAFAGNFICGFFAGLIAQNESFNFKKAKVAIFEAVVYVVLIAGFFTIAEKMDDKEYVLKGLSIITWAWIYFYSVNIAKNLTRLFPHSSGFSFLYYALSMEFIKRFPVLKDFINKNQQKNGNR